jgi:adenine deaminase
MGPTEVEALLQRDSVRFLSEMMNVPGVLHHDPDVMAKIRLAKAYHKVIDGHAPGLRGEALARYVGAGISTDHESFTIEEAREKIRLGMKIQIREGSAARNFDELISIAREHPRSCMFCSDDMHPDDLTVGHINLMVKRAVLNGIDPMDAFRIASVNPIMHYRLDIGLLQKGDPADFLVVDDLANLKILKTSINGRLVAHDGETLMRETPKPIINNFRATAKHVEDFALKNRKGKINIIEARDGQIVTRRGRDEPKVVDDCLVSDPARDILKIGVMSRYVDSRPVVGFVRGFGLKRGAVASSVAHDSHNIICVGADDLDMCRAVNILIENKGGIASVIGEREEVLPLPVGGIMSDVSYQEVATRYSALDSRAKGLGSSLSAPFMTLSFMALLVIPEIKISDKGLFDGNKFEFIDLFDVG